MTRGPAAESGREPLRIPVRSLTETKGSMAWLRPALDRFRTQIRVCGSMRNVSSRRPCSEDNFMVRLLDPLMYFYGGGV